MFLKSIKINDITLWKKFILIYLIVIIIPIFTLEIFLSRSIKEVSFNSSLSLSRVALDQLGENFSKKLGVYYEMMDALVNDPQLNNYLNTDYSSDYDSFYDYQMLVQPFMKMLNYRDSNAVIRVYTNNPSIKFSRITNNTLEDIEQEGWADISAVSPGVINWAGAGNPIVISKTEYLCCYRLLLTGTGSYRQKTVLAVFFKVDELYSLISKENEGGKKIFIYNSQGDILLSTNEENEYSNIKELPLENKHTELNENTSSIDFNGSSYILLNKNISNRDYNIEGWNIMYMIPTGTLYSDIRSITTTSTVLTFICILFSFILTFFLSRNITVRISSILKKISNVKKGKYIISNEASGMDEIGILDDSFNEMIEKIDTLIKEVYEAKIHIMDAELKNKTIETRVKEAEIISLQSQINPHYLFNTLESIRMKLLTRGDKETSEIISIFGETFRLSLSNKKETYKLSEEIRFVDAFFLIQKYRYGDRLNYEKFIPPELMDLYIPKLILQPLVENSIYHGIERKSAGGNVRVSARNTENKLVLTVSDDGIGIQDEKLDILRKNIFDGNPVQKSSYTGIALNNIHTRIRLMYGDEYGLKVLSKNGFGTEVEVHLPLLTEEIKTEVIQHV